MTWEGFTRDVREGGQWGDKRVLNARRGVGVVDKERRRNLIDVGTETCERCLGGQASVKCFKEAPIVKRLSYRNVLFSRSSDNVDVRFLK